MPLLGAHNVRNALAAMAVGSAVGLNTDTMARRRCGASAACAAAWSCAERRDGVAVYDDFAHHPTAIAETLAASARRSRIAALGDLRAALGVLVPAGVPGRFRAAPWPRLTT